MDSVSSAVGIGEVGGTVLMNDSEYLAVLEQVKTEIAQARLRARAAVLREGSLHYWRVGTMLNERSEWGNKFIDNLARDIRLAYPGVSGYSRRSLMYMSRFARTYPTLEEVQRVVAQLPWGHNTALLDRVDDPGAREWYAASAIEHGWSRDVMVLQIRSGLYQRQVTAPKTTNFETRLPPPQSDLAVQMLKDPYIFDVDADDSAKERDIERGLVANIARLLLELGTGFAFVGDQYHITVSGRDFFVDLLFYHLKLRCYVVVELKVGEFKPEFAGKLNFYVSAVDDLLRGHHDEPTIGLLLCQDKADLVAEYSLKDIEKPIGVSEYRLVRELPADLAELLPTAEDIASRITIGGDDQ